MLVEQIRPSEILDPGLAIVAHADKTQTLRRLGELAVDSSATTAKRDEEVLSHNRKIAKSETSSTP